MVRPGGVGGLVGGEIVTDVRGPEKGQPTGDAALGGGRLELGVMADDPVGHIAAVGAAGDAKPLHVDIRISVQDFIREIHQVGVVDGPISSPDIGEVIALAVGALGVAEENEKAPAGPDLHFVDEDIPVDGFGAPVDRQNPGVLGAFFVVDGLKDKAFYDVVPFPLAAQGFGF